MPQGFENAPCLIQLIIDELGEALGHGRMTLHTNLSGTAGKGRQPLVMAGDAEFFQGNVQDISRRLAFTTDVFGFAETHHWRRSTSPAVGLKPGQDRLLLPMRLGHAELDSTGRAGTAAASNP